jgi:hypothetical protein
MRFTSKLAIGSLVAIPGLLALGLPAGAVAPSVTSGGGMSSSESAATALPSSRIVIRTSTGRPHFVPNTLSAAGKKGSACSTKTAGAIIRNRTTRAEQLTHMGAALGSPIPAGGGEFICYISPTGTPPPAKIVFGLSGSKSTLTISFT